VSWSEQVSRWTALSSLAMIIRRDIFMTDLNIAEVTSYNDLRRNCSLECSHRPVLVPSSLPIMSRPSSSTSTMARTIHATSSASVSLESKKTCVSSFYSIFYFLACVNAPFSFTIAVCVMPSVFAFFDWQWGTRRCATPGGE